MACYNDYDGVYFTVQSLRLHHNTPFDLIVVDQSPVRAYADRVKGFVESVGGKYLSQPDAPGGPPMARNAYFEAATTPVVLSVDCHILFQAGSLGHLTQWFRENPESPDLLHGVLLYDCLVNYSTHWAHGWQPANYGTWAVDERGSSPDKPPFLIDFSGVGVMACRKDAWPGYNKDFLGFGAEEWYIHRKFKARGGRTWCHPGVRWTHRFGPIPHINFQVATWKLIYNHLLGSLEVKDTPDVSAQLIHWSRSYPRELASAIQELSNRGYLRIPKKQNSETATISV